MASPAHPNPPEPAGDGPAHHHRFHDTAQAAERGTLRVVWITAAAMVLEVAAGWWFNSMALLADGWHMSSHVVAIGLSALAYRAARRFASDPRFAFGTWKIEVLAAFASAVLLVGVAAMMVFGSIERLLAPQPIAYREAMVVAAIGLAVNLACALILGHAHEDDHDHDHGHGEGHGHGGHHHDLNLRSAYLHVLADAATSVLAIAALAGGWMFGWSWLDPAVGLLGAALVAAWARGLLRDTANILLDREMDHPVTDRIRAAIEGDGDGIRITDLHAWRVGRNLYACTLTLVTDRPGLTPDAVRERLAVHPEVAHATIEIHHRPARTA